MGTEMWKRQLKVLERKVAQHVQEEELDLFEEMKDYLSDDEARRMAKDFQKAKDHELRAFKMHAHA